MSEMYYTQVPTSSHDERTINYKLGAVKLSFVTDAGVFSKTRVDYGSGVLLEQMQLLPTPVGNVLDLGCGYGPIGLFAAKFWPTLHVDLVDVNERALGLAQRNAQLNQVMNVKIYASDIYDKVDGKYGLIVTNPPIRAGKQVVSAILTGAKEHLLPNGELLVVIQKKQGAPSAKKLLEQVYGNCEILKRDKGYYILRAQKK